MARANCPNCGADLPRNAKVCPECGSDEKTGWSDEAHITGLNLPDDNFDYDEFVKDEFGARKHVKPKGLHWGWWVAGILLIIALLLPFILPIFHH